MPRLPIIAAAVGGAVTAAIVTAFFMSGTATLEAEAAEFDQKFKDKVRAVLVEHPEIIVEAMEGYQSKQAAREQEEMQKAVSANLSKIPSTPGIHTVGNKDAKVHMVEFFDYHCGYCKSAMPAVLDMLEDNPDLKISFVEYPIFGDDSARAAAAAIAAGEQGKYLEMHRKLMETKGTIDEERVKLVARELKLDTVQLLRDMESERTQAILDAHDALGVAMGIQGTPAFIINGTPVGGWAEGEIRDLIAEGMKKK